MKPVAESILDKRRITGSAQTRSVGNHVTLLQVRLSQFLILKAAHTRPTLAGMGLPP